MNHDVSIVIPIFRDRHKIGSTLDALADFFERERLTGEIIIVNDGGNDGGAEIVLQKQRRTPSISFISRSANRGKGFTVREGLRRARGRIIFFTDADLPYGTAPIRQMFDLLSAGGADVALANRDLEARQDEQPAWPRLLTHALYSKFVRTLIPIPFTDTLAGLKGMNRKTLDDILPKLTIDRFSFDVELLLIAHKRGYKIKQLPVSLKNVGPSNLKIRRDAPEMIREIIQIWRQLRRGQYD